MLKQKYGAGHFKAWMRQGLEELRNCFYAGSNITPKQVETGIFGSPTMGEIADERRADAPADTRLSILGEKIAQTIRESVGPNRDAHEREPG
jgi:hypothetical protein